MYEWISLQQLRSYFEYQTMVEYDITTRAEVAALMQSKSHILALSPVEG